MKLVLLGTKGGPRLTLNRGNPAQVVQVGDRQFLIDCGEGTPRQLLRAGIGPKDIESVLITHHHSDHNAALGNVLLTAWNSGLTRSMQTIGPPPLSDMIEHFLEMNAYDISTRVADEGRPDPRALLETAEISAAGVVFEDDDVRVTAALVNHPPVEPAFGFRFDAEGRSIVISGDTAPSDDLVELAAGADVLVHEVIHFDLFKKYIHSASSNADWDRLQAHLARSHTSVHEVGKIATAAGVDTLVLSHFVPGHIDVSDETWLAPVRQHFGGKIIAGHDLMEIDV